MPKILALFQLIATVAILFAFAMPQTIEAADCDTLKQQIGDSIQTATQGVATIEDLKKTGTTFPPGKEDEADTYQTEKNNLVVTAALTPIQTTRNELNDFAVANCGKGAFEALQNGLNQIIERYNALDQAVIGRYNSAGTQVNIVITLSEKQALYNTGYESLKGNPTLANCAKLLGSIEGVGGSIGVAIEAAEANIITDVKTSQAQYQIAQNDLQKAQELGCNRGVYGKAWQNQHDKINALNDHISVAKDNQSSIVAKLAGGCEKVCDTKKGLFAALAGSVLSPIASVLSGLCCLLAEFVKTISDFATKQGQLLIDAINTLKTLRDIIFRASPNYQLWNYFRNFVNYGLVIVLIVASFTNVLRINIDTYGVKKVLPGLAIGFIMANLSIYVARLFIDIAQVLTNSFDQLFAQASGGESISHIIGTQFLPVVTALVVTSSVVGATAAPFSFGASSAAGIVIGLLVAIFILFIPVFVLLGLYLLFETRFYVIQFLVFVSPLAFLSLGIPGAQKYFQAWWKYFTTWIFLQPLAYFLMGLAGLILVTNAGGNTPGGKIVTFAISLIALVSAFILPFRAGGAITASLASFGKKYGGLALGGTRTGLRSAGNAAAGSGVWGLSALGRGLSGAMSLPETIQLARKDQEKRNEEKGIGFAAGQLHAAGFIRNPRLLESVQNRGIREFQDEHKFFDSNKLGQMYDDAADPLEKAALMLTLAERGHSERVYKTLKNGPENAGNPQAVKAWETKQLGSGDFAARIGAQLDDLAKKTPVLKSAFRQEYDPSSRKMKSLTYEESVKKAAGMFETDPGTIARSITAKGAIMDDENGKKKIFGAIQQGIVDGSINQEMIVSKNRGFDTGFVKGVREHWNGGMDAQFTKEFEQYLAKARLDQAKRLEDQGQSDTQIKAADRAFALDRKTSFAAYRARLLEGGNAESARQVYQAAGFVVAANKAAKRAARAPRPIETVATATEAAPSIDTRAIDLGPPEPSNP